MHQQDSRFDGEEGPGRGQGLLDLAMDGACEVVSRFELRLPGREVKEAVAREAVHRTAGILGRSLVGEDWELLVVRREALKVLAGGAFHREVRRAMKALASSRKEALTTRIFGLVSAPEGVARGAALRAVLDPLVWPVGGVVLADPEESYVRLSLFASAMLCQEKGIAQAETSLEEAARLACSSG